jgi:Protein of unknown function (DUF3306)
VSRFLARWSRLKKAAETAPEVDLSDPEALLANLTPDGDFAVFLREEIGEEVRRKALRTLFADPRFNVMDGLDIYIDDYSVADPIPEEMLAMMNQARGLLFDEAPPTEDPVQAVAGCDNLSDPGQNVPPLPESSPPASENQ